MAALHCGPRCVFALQEVFEAGRIIAICAPTVCSQIPCCPPFTAKQLGKIRKSLFWHTSAFVCSKTWLIFDLLMALSLTFCSQTSRLARSAHLHGVPASSARYVRLSDRLIAHLFKQHFVTSCLIVRVLKLVKHWLPSGSIKFLSARMFAAFEHYTLPPAPVPESVLNASMHPAILKAKLKLASTGQKLSEQ